MKSLALSLAVLLCASVTQATLNPYTFEDLVGVNQVMRAQSDLVNKVTWRNPVDQALQNTGFWRLREPGGVGTNSYIDISPPATAGEQLFAQAYMFDIGSACRKLSAYFDSDMCSGNPAGKGNGSLVGIWIDGQGLSPAFPVENWDIESGGANSNRELVFQFGFNYADNGSVRVRGANGKGGLISAAGVIPQGPVMTPMRFRLDVTLPAVGDLLSDGRLDLFVDYLNDAPDLGFVQVIVNAPMGLNDVSISAAQKAVYTNPALYKAWWIRNQARSADPLLVGVQTIDNLNLVPEPATMSLLVLGGLACLRRRR